MKAGFRFLALAAVSLTAACTVHGTDIPELTGPSDLALSVSLTATPDSIYQDGASQSSLVIIARDPSGKGVASLPLRVETAVNGAIQDYGTLSARSVTTNADGRATVIYTAPPPPASLGGGGNVVTIGVTPVGSNYQTANTSTADIRLLPPGVVLPPASAPTAKFTVSPTPVNAGIATNFDASASCATQVGCTNAGLVSFSWNFGDGTSAAGMVTTHSFAAPGTYTVTLTVTNDRGLSASTTQVVGVTASALPVANIAFSPTSGIVAGAAPVGTLVTFTAELSTAAPGRSITVYNWDLGTANVEAPQVQYPSGMRQAVRFLVPGRYKVILSVLDDAGQRGTTSLDITVN